MFSFSCQRCGRCCRGSDDPNTSSYVVFLDEDIERIAEHLEICTDSLCRVFGIRNNRIDVTGSECPFLEDDGTCMVHEVKPSACAKWPYIKRHEKPHMLEDSALRCCGIKITGRA